MPIIKPTIIITPAVATKIRKVWDSEKQTWYFSITDIVGVLTDSTDSRNYWKALKNRLKISQNQLVMDCNQLKLPSSDGKSYLADVADAVTLLKIIKVIDPTSIPAFKTWFDHIDVQNSIKNENTTPQNPTTYLNDIEEQNDTENELSTTLIAPADIYQNQNEIVVKFMLPGTDPEKLILNVSMQTLSIKGVRAQENNSNIHEQDYTLKELQWGNFSRNITLPALVDVDNIVATEMHGLITITLTKIDTNRKRFIKIKSI